ncbi:hypothetical protein N7456_013385 [Penicillium angulare]|uniref:Uncharacterized protein n=1 Tax=Penicillium angulare TaxID=116970 RepID=A0A9W9EG13_9EURO|nr:hypothetical protein N7456_013385 [Penicillium angulare]
MDERRCFSYFMHISIPNLSTFFTATLWHKHARQMSVGDRAVYHAANMLGAIHEEATENNMRLWGENLRRSHQRVALEQGSRAFAHLHARQASQDPEFREVVLVCCLFFVIGDLMMGRYENAFIHLRSGLKVLAETQNKQLVDQSIIETFTRLDNQSSHFGAGRVIAERTAAEQLPRHDSFYNINTIDGLHAAVCNVLSSGIPFLAKCWKLSTEEREADYLDLTNKQSILIARCYELRDHIESFYQLNYHQASYQQKQALGLLRLQCPGQLIGLKTCLTEGAASEDLIPDFQAVMLLYHDFVNKFPERPTISVGHGVLPILWVVASKCPQYSGRLEAINALLAWPHCEGFVNSNMVASVALEALKVELAKGGVHDLSSLLDAKGHAELTEYLNQTKKSTPQLGTWSPIKAAKILDKQK